MKQTTQPHSIKVTGSVVKHHPNQCLRITTVFSGRYHAHYTTRTGHKLSIFKKKMWTALTAHSQHLTAAKLHMISAYLPNFKDVLSWGPYASFWVINYISKIVELLQNSDFTDTKIWVVGVLLIIYRVRHIKYLTKDEFFFHFRRNIERFPIAKCTKPSQYRHVFNTCLCCERNWPFSVYHYIWSQG